MYPWEKSSSSLTEHFYGLNYETVIGRSTPVRKVIRQISDDADKPTYVGATPHFMLNPNTSHFIMVHHLKEVSLNVSLLNKNLESRCRCFSVCSVKHFQQFCGETTPITSFEQLYFFSQHHNESSYWPISGQCVNEKFPRCILGNNTKLQSEYRRNILLNKLKK